MFEQEDRIFNSLPKDLENPNFYAKPFLKWVGGKKQILPQIRQYIPKEYKRYFEPFIGGGALFFTLRPKIAHINDINKKLISAYRNIKNHPDKIIKCLENLQNEFYKKNDDDRKIFFYEIRNKFNDLEDDSTEKTSFLIFLNKTCFNGMYRENSKGKFNVPFGRYKNPRILDEKNIIAVSKLLQEVTITNDPFEKSVEGAKSEDFIYFDPPYHPLSKTSNFTGYSNGGFIEKDQEKLGEVFKELVGRGCYVLLSNSDTEFIRKIYKDYKIEVVSAARSINCKASGRGKINELLIMNY